ncbi:MAG: hypothetical protein OHK0046_29720 [Anaerolineae bacterium]
MSEALQEAKNQLTALIDAARTGAIIPVRLPGQLEAIQTLLEQANADYKDAQKQASAPSGDLETFMQENAEFLRHTFHELRTPITNIRGYSDMLNNTAIVGELSAMQAQLLDVVRSNTRRMETLLTDLSYLNKLRGRILEPATKMDLYKNIAGMVEKKARPIAQELNRQLEFITPEGMPPITTDGELFSVAMVKLIENGLRYSNDDGKVTVEGKGEGSRLIITIRDNGIGMSPEELAKLGTLYYRADHDIIRNHKGSGIGVHLAYGIIALLGGEYSVTSTPGQGTCFTLTFEGMA